MDWFETAMKIFVVMASFSGLLVVKRLLTGPRGDRRYPWWTRQDRGDLVPDADLADLRQTVERLHGDVAELQERLDFTERMLAQQRERSALPER